MSGSKHDPPIGDGLRPKYNLQVHRSARPPLAWIWEIHLDGVEGAFRRAVRGYRSAEEAWEAGRATLERLSHAEGLAL
jgi:hypothetical protein